MSAQTWKEKADQGPILPPDGSGTEVGPAVAIEAEAAEAPPELPPKKPTAAKGKILGRRFFGSELDRFFPTSNRIKIEKRADDGHLQAIPRLYRPQELARSADVEDFIAQYLVPTYEGGDYIVTLLDGENKRIGSQEVSVLAPPGASSESGQMAGLVERLVDRIGSLEDRVREDRLTPQQPKSLPEQLREAKEAMASLGSDPSLLMFLMMQQQNRPPAVDTELRDEIRELCHAVKEVTKAARGSQDLPRLLPDIPTQGSGHTDLGELGELLQGIVSSVVSHQQRPQETAAQDPIAILKEAKALFAPTEGEASGAVRDLREEIRVLKATIDAKAGSGGGFGDTMDTIDKVLDRFGAKGGSESTTGDKIIQGLDMLTDPDRIEAMGRAVGAWRESLTGASPPRGKDKKVVYPSGFRKFTQALEAAKTDEAIVETSMRAIEFLGQHTAWQGHVLAMVGACHKEDEREVLKFATAFLEGLEGAGKIDKATMQRSVDAFSKHIGDVIATVNAAAGAQKDEEE